MTYNELKMAVTLLNDECQAGIKIVAVKHEVLEAEFKEASVYFAGEAEKAGTRLSEELQAFYRDLTGEELHQTDVPAMPAPVPGEAPATVTPVVVPVVEPAAPGLVPDLASATPATRRVAASTPPSAIAVDVPIPQGAARRKTSARYPFASMNVNESFFVPSTDERPDPAKSMQSTVSSAVRKFSVEDPSGATRVNKNGKTVPVMNPTKVFICRAVDDGGPWGFPGVPGAGIWRTA